MVHFLIVSYLKPFYNELFDKEVQHNIIIAATALSLQTFLADYGMVWVGEKINSDSDVYKEDSEEEEEEMWRPG